MRPELTLLEIRRNWEREWGRLQNPWGDQFGAICLALHPFTVAEGKRDGKSPSKSDPRVHPRALECVYSSMCA